MKLMEYNEEISLLSNNTPIVIFGYISTCPTCEAKKINFELAYRDFKLKKDELISDYKLKYFPKSVNFIKIDCIKY